MGHGVCHSLAYHVSWQSRQVVSTYAEDHELCAHLVENSIACTLDLILGAPPELKAKVIVGRIVLAEPKELHIGLPQGHCWIRGQAHCAGDRQIPLRREPLFFQSGVHLGVVPPERSLNFRESFLVDGVDGKISEIELVALGGTLAYEAQQLGTKKWLVACSSSDFYDSAGSLSKAFVSLVDRNDDDGSPADRKFMDRVAAGIADIVKRLMDCICGARVQLSAGDRAIVLDADEDHASIGVGERNHRILQRVATDPSLELNVLPLFWKLSPEIRGIESKAQLRPSRVKWRIWQTCLTRFHAFASLPYLSKTGCASER